MIALNCSVTVFIETFVHLNEISFLNSYSVSLGKYLELILILGHLLFRFPVETYQTSGLLSLRCCRQMSSELIVSSSNIPEMNTRKLHVS